MITQAELRPVWALMARIAGLRKRPELVRRAAREAELDVELAAAQAGLEATAAYRAFAAVRDRVSGAKQNLPRYQVDTDLVEATAELGRALEALKKRYRADPEVEPGKLRLVVQQSPRVSWEGVLDRIRALPVVAALLGKTPEAVELLRQAADRDVKASFVSVELKRFEVVSG